MVATLNTLRTISGVSEYVRQHRTLNCKNTWCSDTQYNNTQYYDFQQKGVRITTKPVCSDKCI
jgi:hypothetical protein